MVDTIALDALSDDDGPSGYLYGHGGEGRPGHEPAGSDLQPVTGIQPEGPLHGPTPVVDDDHPTVGGSGCDARHLHHPVPDPLQGVGRADAEPEVRGLSGQRHGRPGHRRRCLPDVARSFHSQGQGADQQRQQHHQGR